jgi:2-amino-1-hydroxyethylphosphonate dioxygenase (glycine-forming)
MSNFYLFFRNISIFTRLKIFNLNIPMNNYSNVAQLLEGVTHVFDLYRDFGENDYIGEQVTQLEHAIQCAEHASIEFPDNYDIILGTFLHDVGHLLSLRDHEQENKFMEFEYDNKSLNGLGLVNHEDIGARFLEKMGFSTRLASIGKNHVLAKRYLITEDPSYLNKLSDASKETFKLQGGSLSLEEKNNFENMQDKDLFLRMRVWDDLAKDTAFIYNEKHGIGYYEDMACKLVFKD